MCSKFKVLDEKFKLVLFNNFDYSAMEFKISSIESTKGRVFITV